jgi:hypothetical protein
VITQVKNTTAATVPSIVKVVLRESLREGKIIGLIDPLLLAPYQTRKHDL